MGGKVVAAVVCRNAGQGSSEVTGMKGCMYPYGDMDASLGGVYAENDE